METRLYKENSVGCLHIVSLCVSFLLFMSRLDPRMKKSLAANIGVGLHFFNSRIMKKQMKEAGIGAFTVLLYS